MDRSRPGVYSPHKESFRPEYRGSNGRGVDNELSKDFFNAPGCSVAVRPQVRELCLDALGVQPGNVVWDVGAGSGSVSLVSALRHPEARYYCLEKSSCHYRTLARNVLRLGTTNVIPCSGEAPEVLDALPRPDRIYLGGSGGRIESIVPVLRDRLTPSGRLVATFLGAENFAVGRDCFDRSLFRVVSRTVYFDDRDFGDGGTGEAVHFLLACGIGDDDFETK